MLFIVDSDRKFLFGWSPKCGCSLVKTIAWYLIDGDTEPTIHTYRDIMNLPDDIENYTAILVVRNPYQRIVSGFLDKYHANGIYRCMWTSDQPLTFRNFVGEVVRQNWCKIDFHHFAPQTGDKFEEDKIRRAKNLIVYDVANIDYHYIGSLYNTQIPSNIIERNKNVRPKYSEDFCVEHLYDKEIDEYFSCNVVVSNFYNDEIKQKVYDFYKKDFVFFKDQGFNYNVDI
jgi:hypothetical protein